MKAIFVFIATAYALAIALSLMVGLTGGSNSALIGLGYLSMFVPAIAVLIATLTMDEPPRVRWECFPVKYLPLALFAIPLVLHAAMLPMMAYLAGGLHWQNWLTPEADGLYHTPASLRWGVLTAKGLAARIVLNALVGVVVVSALAFFEEIGWRAWLLPRLVDRLGARPAVWATSIIWAVWHVPFQLSGIHHIDGVQPLKLALTMPVGTVAAGLFLGWLWLRTKSIWLVAIGHGALNNWGQYGFKFMQDSATPDRDLAVLIAGSLALLAAGVFVTLFALPEAVLHTRRLSSH